MDPTQQHLMALGTFKDWSNYLLVTTVAALGWVATTSHPMIGPLSLGIVVGCLTLSIIFGIITLAFIPHIATDIRADTKSFYEVPVCYRRFWRWGEVRPHKLIGKCAPQHVLFLAGIIAFAVGRIYFLWYSHPHAH